MASSRGGRAGASALQERVEAERDGEPRAQAEREGCKQPEIDGLGAVDPSRNHRAGTLLPLAGIVLLQGAWVAFLGYLAYSAWIHLPF